MISASTENAIEQESLGPSNKSNNETSSSLERLTLTPPRLQAFGSDSPNNPWAEIDALYRSQYADPPRDSTTTGSSLEPEAYSHEGTIRNRPGLPGSRGGSTTRKPRITKADRARMEQEKLDRERMGTMAPMPGNYGAGMAQLAGAPAVAKIPGGDSGDETLQQGRDL